MQTPAPTALLLLAMLATAPATAQTGAPAVADLPGDVLDDVRALPSRENGWWLLGGAALTVLVHQFEDADGTARALAGEPWGALADVGNVWGDVRFQAPLALGAWAAGSWADNPHLAGTGYALSRGLLLTYGVTSVIKVAVDRERPNGDGYSFPSGHTAAAFTTAGVLTRRHGAWVGGAALVLGGLTAMGRMEDMKHHASDVVAGATIGWIVGRTVARDDSEDRRAWRVVPLGAGVALARGF